MSDLEESKIVSHAISLGKEEDDEWSKHEEEQKRKKLQGAELIEENMKEVQEVIAFMDYSFERAFTMQEKECMLAYKVSKLDTKTNEHYLYSCTFPKYNRILTL